MSTSEMINKIKGGVDEEETIIPMFQNPDTCVFCDDKAYDDIIFLLLRAYYNDRNGTKYEKLDKETCIHHKDRWLKHSYRTGGFMGSAFKEHCKNSMTNNEMVELFGNKNEREKLLTEYYNKAKEFSCAAHLYLTVPPENMKHRYNNSFTIEDDIPIQNKIIRNKVKIEYTHTIEVLQAYGEDMNDTD